MENYTAIFSIGWKISHPKFHRVETGADFMALFTGRGRFDILRGELQVL